MSTSGDEFAANPDSRPEAEPEKEPESDQTVGYGRPPKAAQFKKGSSGNPKGRPKGSLNVATVFVKTLRERVVINEHGRRKTVTKLEAALKQLVNKAASGDIRAVRQLLDSARDAEAKQNASGAQNPAMEERDQEVIDGILSRFQAAEDVEGEGREPTEDREDKNVDGQRS